MEAPGETTIRALVPADLPAVVALVRRTIRISYDVVYPPSAIAFFESFHAEERVAERAAVGTVLVAYRDGTLIGTGSLRGDEIFAVFVDPACQGQGVGRELMLRLEDRARADGVTETTLSISLPSRRFYDGLGYEVVEERCRELPDGAELRFWKARKRLDNSSA